MACPPRSQQVTGPTVGIGDPAAIDALHQRQATAAASALSGVTAGRTGGAGGLPFAGVDAGGDRTARIGRGQDAVVCTGANPK